MANVIFHYKPPAQVSLVTIGGDSIDLGIVTRGYSGVYENFISPEDAAQFMKDLEATKLKTPSAFIGCVWLLKNVTRNFEQQLTRYRVGTAFVAESLRFSDKRSAEFYCKQKTTEGKVIYEKHCWQAVSDYVNMIGYGEAVQDARDVLPSSICTHMFAYLNLQTLAHIYEQRSCCQAQQEEWACVLEQMRDAIFNQDPALASLLKRPWDNPACVDCGFRASFDRPCTNQHHFDNNARLAYDAYCKRKHAEAMEE